MPNELSKISDFKRAFQEGTKRRGIFHDSYLSLHPHSEGVAGQDAYAVVTSKKAVSKKAVRRNLAKRRIRPIIWKILQERNKGSLKESQSTSVWWVVRARREVLEASPAALTQDLQLEFDRFMKTARPREK